MMNRWAFRGIPDGRFLLSSLPFCSLRLSDTGGLNLSGMGVLLDMGDITLRVWTKGGSTTPGRIEGNWCQKAIDHIMGYEGRKP